MKILIVHRYYWPDTAPAATIFRTIAQRWVADGHDVVAFSTQPSYSDDAEIGRQPKRQELDGSTVRRVSLLPESKRNYVARSLNYGIFFSRAFAHVVTSRNYDMVIGLTAPPLLPGLVLRAAARLTGAQFVYHCGDIYPELAASSGLMTQGLRYRLLRRIDSVTAKKSARVVVLSTDMRDLMVERGVDESKIRIIQNLDLEAFGETAVVPDELQHGPDEFRVLFAGNHGRFQSLPSVIEAAHLLANEPRIRFDFFGSGIALQELRELSGELQGHTVHFHGRVPPSTAAAIAAEADLALVTLTDGVIKAAYPSKTMTYLRAGTPLMGMVEPDSELGTMITGERLGAVVPPGDAVGLADAIRQLADADLGLSDTERVRLEREVRGLERRIKRNEQDFREELNIQKNNEFKKVRVLVLEAIARFGKRNDYDLIVSDGVLYANKRIDVTERILESLVEENARLQSAN